MGKYRNLVGERFGRLVITKEFKKIRDDGKVLYYARAKCDCGNVIEATKGNFTRTKKRSLSCGCLQKEKAYHTAISNFSLPFGEAAFNNIYRRYRYNAKVRGYSFELTKEEFASVITKPCIYCGQTPNQKQRYADRGTGDFRYVGIDRYDNTRGYTLDNSVPCCRICNRIKTDMEAGFMLDHLTKMLNNKDKWMKKPPTCEG